MRIENGLTLPYFPVVGGVASAALPTIPVGVSVGLVVGMAVRAMSFRTLVLAPLLFRNAVAILSMGNRIKMFGTNAVSYSTKMVKAPTLQGWGRRRTRKPSDGNRPKIRPTT